MTANEQARKEERNDRDKGRARRREEGGGFRSGLVLALPMVSPLEWVDNIRQH